MNGFTGVKLRTSYVDGKKVYDFHYCIKMELADIESRRK